MTKPAHVGLKDELNMIEHRVFFVQSVCTGSIALCAVTKDQLCERVTREFPTSHDCIDFLLSTPAFYFTIDGLQQLLVQKSEIEGKYRSAVEAASMIEIKRIECEIETLNTKKWKLLAK